MSPPAGVRDLLESRIDAVQETTVQVVSAAAVLQGRFDADLVRSVSGRSDAETSDALDEAIRYRLLEESCGWGGDAASRTTSRSRHCAGWFSSGRRLLGVGCCTGGPPMRCRAATSGTRLATVSAAVVAHHFEQSGRDSEAAAWWWRAAARSRALYAHEQAYSDLARALALGY